MGRLTQAICIFSCVTLASAASVSVAVDEDLIKQKLADALPKPEGGEIANGLASLFTLGLLGGTMALYSKRNEDANSVDRSGYYYEDPAITYAQRVNDFENRVYGRFASTLGRISSRARKTTSKIRNASRRLGQKSLNVVRAGAHNIRRMAANTDQKLRGIARTANRGLRRLSSSMNRVGTGGISRMGNVGTNVGTAAIRGLYKVSKAYINGLGRARENAVNGLWKMGQTYRRGMSRVGSAFSGLAHAYNRGVARMGTAASAVPSLSDVAADGVSRLGEIASHGAAKIGDLATEVADVAEAVPKRLTKVATDKKMRDCLLQAMCYVSTPFIDPNSNYVKRSIPEVDEEHVPGVGTGGGHMLRMEDCEAFKCEVVSLGRKAYEMVSKGLVGGPHDED